MAGYILSQQADQSLEEIESYTSERWGDAQTERYIEHLFDGFDQLAENPSLGRRRQDIPPLFRVLAVGMHLIVYNVGDTEAVEIFAILHPAMNVAERLKAAIERARRPR